MIRKAKEPSSVSVLLHIPVFRRLWAAIAISSLGDWLGLLATTSLAAYLTKGASGLAQGVAVSGVLVIRLLPDLLLGPVAGAVVDRIDRRKIAVFGDTVAGLLYLSIAVTGNLTWLLVAQFLVEAVGLFSNPAKQAMWVNIVPRERLAVANQLNYVSIYGMVPVAAALFALLSTVAQFFGASAAGASSSGALISGPTSSVAINIALVIDAVTYFVCAATVLLSRNLIPAFVGERSEAKSIFKLIGEGVSFVKNSKIMRALYIGILGAFGAGGLTAGVAQAYVSALGAGNAGYGILFGSVFTGLALGMLTGPKLLPTVPRRMIFTSAVGAAGLVLVVMSTLQDFLGAAISSALMGWFAGIAWITGFTMIGHEVSDRLRGRVFAFVMSSVRLTLLATIAVGPVVAGLVGSHQIKVGDFEWNLSGSAIVLAVGGLVAMLVAMYSGRQVGGLASAVFRRILGRRRSEMLSSPPDYPGAFISFEGADPVAAEQMRATVEARLRADGWLVAEGLSIGLLPASPGRTAEPDTPATALRSVAHLAELVAATVRPELQAGAVVLTSGYIDARIVRYGAVAGLGEEQLLRMALWAVDGLLPDLTILVDVPAALPDSAAAATDGPVAAVRLGSGAGPSAAHGSAGPAGELEAEAMSARGRAGLAGDTAACATRVEGAGDAVGDPVGDAAAQADATAAAGAAAEADAEGPAADPVQAYRDRASSAPERYLIVGRKDADLTPEVLERISATLRQRMPSRTRTESEPLITAVDPAREFISG